MQRKISLFASAVLRASGGAVMTRVGGGVRVRPDYIGGDLRGGTTSWNRSIGWGPG
jgi:hypothetical protein